MARKSARLAKLACVGAVVFLLYGFLAVFGITYPRQDAGIPSNTSAIPGDIVPSEPRGHGSEPLMKRSEPYVQRIEPFDKRIQPFDQRIQPFDERIQPFDERIQPFAPNIEPLPQKIEPIDYQNQPIIYLNKPLNPPTQHFNQHPSDLHTGSDKVKVETHPLAKSEIPSQAPPTGPTRLLTIDHQVGRIGNRMFKYASLLGIAHSLGRRPFINPFTFETNLVQLFNLSHAGRFIFTHGFMKIQESKYAYFDPKFQQLPDKDVEIIGYVQSWKYFDAIKDDIRREFSFLPQYRDHAEAIKNSVRQRFQKPDLVFVGVHVRQKDKYSTPNTTEASTSFFYNAFDIMRSLLVGRDLVFLVAGNNLTWCQENLKGKDVYVLEPDSAEKHFAVLASCDHGVVSTGTYGWWASWLTGGHVIYYKKFPMPGSYEARGFVKEDYYPPGWIPVDG